ncbi:hypothetical protein MRB53_041092 [Persea americana]|nr:hypothetical protein MRB53_041092 [Persea americana]
MPQLESCHCAWYGLCDSALDATCQANVRSCLTLQWVRMAFTRSTEASPKPQLQRVDIAASKTLSLLHSQAWTAPFGERLHFLAHVKPALVPLHFISGPAFRVDAGSAATAAWFSDSLLRLQGFDSHGSTVPWYETSQVQSPVAVLAKVLDTTHYDAAQGITELLFLALQNGDRLQDGSNGSTGAPQHAGVALWALPIAAGSKQRATMREASRIAAAPFSLASGCRIRAASERRQAFIAVRRGVHEAGAAEAQRRNAGPSQAARTSVMEVVVHDNDEVTPQSRSPFAEPSVEARNKQAISRTVMAGMRIYGLQQRKVPIKRSASQVDEVAPAAVPEDVDADEYKQIYHLTYKGVIFAFPRLQETYHCCRCSSTLPARPSLVNSHESLSKVVLILALIYHSLVDFTSGRHIQADTFLAANAERSASARARSRLIGSVEGQLFQRARNTKPVSHAVRWNASNQDGLGSEAMWTGHGVKDSREQGHRRALNQKQPSCSTERSIQTREGELAALTQLLSTVADLLRCARSHPAACSCPQVQVQALHASSKPRHQNSSSSLKNMPNPTIVP